MRVIPVLPLALAAAAVLTSPATTVRAEEPPPCEAEYDSTFALIQKAIFENRGCTRGGCHDLSAKGGLELTAEAAYDNLVDASVGSLPAEIYPGLKRVTPGRKGDSLLWLNLAAATLPDQWQTPGAPMPQGGLPPLTLDELDAVRLWIEEGAARNGVVPGTGELLDACLPPPEPLEVEPLPPPLPGQGVQIRSPRQLLEPESEREVCFVSYYDLREQVPEEFRSPDGERFRFKRVDARQDPFSHHAVVIVYTGEADIHDPVWGEFRCRGGARNGETCRPTDLASCGDGGVCGSEPVPSVACIGYGPGDASIGVGTESLFSTMAANVGDAKGVYDEAPLRGILVWNSHAFNLNDEEAKLDIWINFEFAAPDEQIRPLRRFVDVSAITKMRPPAYGVDEVCHRYVMPPESELLEISSHVHRRGKRFRVFEGAFTCQGGPHDGAPCSPLWPDPRVPIPDLCAGAACASLLPPDAGDCNGDMRVSIDELVLGVRIALGLSPVAACGGFDVDSDRTVSIDEVVAGVRASVRPERRDPEESLLYTSLTYADPVVLPFSPPLVLGAAGSSAAERTLTYCALYDNGFTDRAEVKRESTTPANGRRCQPTHCAEGAVDRPCSGTGRAERDRSCDSAPAAGDGFCDACPAGFGVTTEDEMFVLLGSYLLD